MEPQKGAANESLLAALFYFRRRIQDRNPAPYAPLPYAFPQSSDKEFCS